MKLLALLPVLAVAALAAEYKVALPGYRFEFPRDHFDHPDFKTEWWYYTGNLATKEGRRFGFELTFFRQAVDRPEKRTSIWQVDDLFLAHFAVSDIQERRFFYWERLNRRGPGIAGADEAEKRIWNGNWEVRWRGDIQQLQAIVEDFSVRLSMTPRKPPVIHGINGVSQKAAGPGRASHYVSFSRLEATGVILVSGREYRVEGSAWMDHEFFTNQLGEDQSGWDWFSLQLEDNTELMLFRLRRKDGTVDPYSAGTYIDSAGSARYLRRSDLRLTPLETWESAKTGAKYPIRWQIEVAPLQLRLLVSTPLRSQEVVNRNSWTPSYWEGAIDAEGRMGERPVRGRGYLEMAGYDRPVQFGGK